MHLKTIAGEHTLDLDRLKNGWVLDVGSRGFEFAAEMADMGCRVLSVDPSINVSDPHINNVIVENIALSDIDGTAMFCDWGNGSGSHLVNIQPGNNAVGAVYSVTCVSIKTLMKCHGIPHFDAIKLDCEGAEYSVMAAWPGPVATQVTGAFHDFIAPGDFTKHDQAVSHLKNWYDSVQDEATVRHGHAPACHWDSLFVLR
jgi:FkbM family methyltransferase